MRINPYVGLSRTRRFRMVDMCKGKRKIWLRGTDDVLVVGLHMVGKRVKVSSLNNVTSFLALYFFLSLDSSLSYLSCHSSSIFFFSFILSLIFFLSLLFYYFFLSLPYSYFFLYFSLYWHLFEALNSSLSCMHTIWNFK
jgi:hypothetical protein